jgi:hypothetical protein
MEALWAELREGRGAVVVLRHARTVFGDRSTADAQTEELRQAILAHRGREGVVIMVTHMVNVVAAGGVSPQQGEALVVRGTPQGSIEIIGRLLVDAGSQP